MEQKINSSAQTTHYSLLTTHDLIKLAAPCFSCGTCSATCPWGLVKEEAHPVRKTIRQVQLGEIPSPTHDSRLTTHDFLNDIWLCTTCKACEAQCPRGVPIAHIMMGLREIAWATNNLPKGVSSIAWSLYFGGNPWQKPPSERMNWAKDLKLKTFDKSDELLLYIGCTASYDRRIQKVARSLIKLLEAAEISFGVLGDKEPCCGEAMMSMGQKTYTQELIAANTKLFNELQVKTLVALSPHCFDMFKNYYVSRKSSVVSSDHEPFRVLHYTQYLADLIEKKQLVFKDKLPLVVTYHDPCYLGRANGEYEAPRKILHAIPGIKLVEMKETKEFSLCCGGGGGRMFMETEAKERFATIRVKDAIQTEADILATSCPFCIACLEDSAKGLSAPMEVLDVAEIAAYALNPESFPSKKGKLTPREVEELEVFYLKGQTSG